METMNAVTPMELSVAEAAGQTALSPAAARAGLYHFFEVVLAHPGEEGIEYFRHAQTEAAFLDAVGRLSGSDGALVERCRREAQAFFTAVREMSDGDVESAHIAMFSANFPHLPCPPYGSLFTAPDAEKRLDEMLAIKRFYQDNGVDVAETFDDLPDHLCVELEFAQLLAFRENEAAAGGDMQVLEGIRRAEKTFLDRFLFPLADRLADLAAGAVPASPYTRMLEALRCHLSLHRQDLGGASRIPPMDGENQP